MKAPVSIRVSSSVVAAVMLIVLTLGRQAGAQSWSCSLAPIPSPHGNAVAAVARDASSTQRIYVLGGMDSNSSAASAVESYHPGSNTWAVHTPIPANRAMARRAGATGANGKIYLFGGQIGNQQSAHVDEYDPQGDSWTVKSSTSFTARWLAAAAPGKDGSATNLIFVFGGETNVGQFQLSTVEAYNPLTDSWQTKASMPAQAGHVKAARACNGRIYVFGGDSSAAAVCAYNPANDTWSGPLAPMPLARWQFAVTTGRNGHIYVLGGNAAGTGVCSTDVVDVYHPNTDTWNTYAVAPQSCTKRNDLAAASLGSKVYSIGGGNHGACGIYPETTIEGLGPIPWSFQCGFQLATATAVTFHGRDFLPVGDANIAGTDAGGVPSVNVNNIGSSGEDGVAVELGQAAGYELALDAGDVKPGASMDVTAVGMRDGVENGTGLSARAEHRGDAVDLSVMAIEPPPPPGVRLMPIRKTVSLYRRGALVSQQGDLTGDGVASVVASAGASSIPWPKDIHIITHPDGPRPVEVIITFDGVLTGRRAKTSEATVNVKRGEEVVECDRVVVSFEESPRLPAALSGVVLTGTNLGSVTVTDDARAVELDGQPHYSLGDAALDVQLDSTGKRRLPVSNLGSSGQDGVVVDLKGSGGGGGGAGGFEVAFDTTGVRPGSRMTADIRCQRRSGETSLGDFLLTAAHTGSSIDLSLVATGLPPAAPPMVVHLRRGGVVVATGDVTGDGIARVVPATPDPEELARFFIKDLHIRRDPITDCIVITITFDGLLGTERGEGAGAASSPEIPVELGGVVHICDSVQVVVEDPSPSPFTLDSFALTASNLDSFTITGENVIPSEPPAPELRRSDANGDGRVDIGDPIFTLGFLFLGGTEPACMDAADANDNGGVDLSDAVFGLNYLFLGGRAPPAPGAMACGSDPTGDNLDCASYSRC